MVDPAADPIADQDALDALAALTAGADLWHTRSHPGLGLAALKMSDGPNGVRGAAYEGGPNAACFPIATALAATWDTELVEAVGRALGRECHGKGAHLLLAPTVNLQRHPLAGRNFECFSEDPELTARMAVAFVAGVQSQGVGCVIKHFVANDSEYERYTISSEVDMRTLRELYLRPFYAAVSEAHVWAIMTAYNRLNGTPCSANTWLLTDLLKGEWGFDGLVMSDWMGTYETEGPALAGLDLEMPGPGRWLGRGLAEAIGDGRLPASVLDDKVTRLRRVAEWAGAASRPPGVETGEDDPAVRTLIRRAGAEAMVLLRNAAVRSEGVGVAAAPLLPLRLHPGQKVAVIGPLAERGTIMGGGSSQVRSHEVSNPLAALRERLGEAGFEVVYEQGCRIDRYAPELAPPDGFTVSVSEDDGETWRPAGTAPRIAVGLTGDGSEPTARAAWRWQGRVAASEDGDHTFSLTAAGWGRLWLDGELVVDTTPDPVRGDSYYGWGTDEIRVLKGLQAGRFHEIEAEFHPVRSVSFVALRIGLAGPVDPAMLDRAAGAARSAAVAIVVVGLTSEWETEGVDRVSLDLPSPQAELVEAVVAACPNTIVVLNIGSPVRVDWAERVPALLVAWYPGMEFGNALADVLTGVVNPAGRLPTTFPRRLEDCPAYLNYPGEAGRVRYGEGVFIGYRGFDARDTEPAFPFGHGLSYTTFQIADLGVRNVTADRVEVAVTVINTGTVSGAEVVQLYLAAPDSPVARPPKELVAFAKVVLQPGERRSVELTVPRALFGYWDETVGGWTEAPGRYELLAGSSSRHLPGRAELWL